MGGAVCVLATCQQKCCWDLDVGLTTVGGAAVSWPHVNRNGVGVQM